jgi:hypothetical protein
MLVSAVWTMMLAVLVALAPSGTALQAPIPCRSAEVPCAPRRNSLLAWGQGILPQAPATEEVFGAKRSPKRRNLEKFPAQFPAGR